MVMANGQIIDEGTHAELMARGGHYAELYNAYSGTRRLITDLRRRERKEKP